MLKFRPLRARLRAKNGGFTLIELLVTTAITAIILLTASTMLMTFFLSNTRTNIRRQIKAEGNRAMSRIEFVARGASDCSYPFEGGTLFTNLDNTRARFYQAGNLLKMDTQNSSGGVTGTENLITTYTISDLSLACTSEGTSKIKYANIKFTLASTGAETATIKETFTSLVVLRNSK